MPGHTCPLGASIPRGEDDSQHQHPYLESKLLEISAKEKTGVRQNSIGWNMDVMVGATAATLDHKTQAHTEDDRAVTEKVSGFQAHPGQLTHRQSCSRQK